MYQVGAPARWVRSGMGTENTSASYRRTQTHLIHIFLINYEDKKSYNSWYRTSLLMQVSEVCNLNLYKKRKELHRFWKEVSENNQKQKFVVNRFGIPVIQKKNFETRGFWVHRYELQEVQWTSVMQRPKRSGDHWYFQCPYRYALNERKRPRDAKFFFWITETKKIPTNIYHKDFLHTSCKQHFSQ